MFELENRNLASTRRYKPNGEREFASRNLRCDICARKFSDDANRLPTNLIRKLEIRDRSLGGGLKYDAYRAASKQACGGYARRLQRAPSSPFLSAVDSELVYLRANLVNLIVH